MPYVALIRAVRVRDVKKCFTDVTATVIQDTAERQPRIWIHPCQEPLKPKTSTQILMGTQIHQVLQ